MQSLREIQQAFGQALIGADAQRAASFVAGNGMDPAARLRIYRNNHRENSLGALRSTFPVIERLVGEAFFRQVAVAYLLAHPSQSGNLDELGERFPRYLADRFGESDYSYLPDVARLEWCCQEVAVAADRAPLDLEKLRAVPPDSYPFLVFHAHPAVRLVESRFPVLRIWSANQPQGSPDENADECIALDAPEKGSLDRIIVTRAEHRIELRLLERTEFEFLAAVLRGEDFATCAGNAAACGHFDASAVLLRLVGAQILVDFSVENPSSRIG